MPDKRRSIGQLLLALLVSLSMHSLVLFAPAWFGLHDLSRPVMPPPAVTLEISPPPERPEPARQVPPEMDHKRSRTGIQPPAPTVPATSPNRQYGKAGRKSAPPPPAPPPGAAAEPDPLPVTTDGERPPAAEGKPPPTQTDAATATQTVIALPPPLRSAAEFLSAEVEILSYRITLLGLPVGSGELAAKREHNGVRISLRVTSNALIATLYPVDDLVETRLLNGNHIITRIRQREGSFRGDRGFTLFLREKSVFWIDLLKKVSTRERLPSSDVLDILSGLYYLRNRPLQVGKTETLQIFDSNVFTPVPVDVLRREELELSGVGKVPALLLHPRIVTEGIFRRTGEILIWVTDDDRHVPVRVETSVLPGRVTAELIDSRVAGGVATETGEREIP